MNSKPEIKNKASKLLYVLVFLLSTYACLSLLGGYSAEAKNNEQAFYRHALIKGCVEDAGEYIFRKVKDVEGLAQLRLREYKGDMLTLINRGVRPYDIYGYTNAELEGLPYQFINPPFINYKFFETPFHSLVTLPSWTKTFKLLANLEINEEVTAFRYSGYKQNHSEMKVEAVDHYLSRYGFTFKETHSYESGYKNLIGSELIVLDLKTNEVIGVRKAYTTIVFNKTIMRCPVEKFGSYARDFVSEVLIPTNS